jgi:hypothetical protein
MWLGSANKILNWLKNWVSLNKQKERFMLDEPMPGLIPQLYAPTTKWHAVQITVFDQPTKRGRSVKANVQAKLDRSERWGNTVLDQMIALQGRGRDARRAMMTLSETCVDYGHDDLRLFMINSYNKLKTEMISLASAGNLKWKENYLRTGFGREKAIYTPGTANVRPLNPGVIGMFDRGTMTFGLQLGGWSRVETLSDRVTQAQKDAGIIAYGMWLIERPTYNIPLGTETPAQRFARFQANRS